jgi:LacI family transcriptional regulator
MVDVAERAGVSLSTVSNVLNRPEVVADDTQARVQEAIAALKFVRNSSARQLRRGRSSSVGVIVFDLSNPYWGEVTTGVESVLSERDFVLMTGSSDASAVKEQRLLEAFDERRPEGILVASVQNIKHLIPLSKGGTHIVLLGGRGEKSSIDSVAIDDRHGGQLGAEHLFSLGHKRIGFVNGPLERESWSERRRGVLDAVNSMGLTWDDAVLEITIATPSAREGDSIVDRMLAANPRPTALFCANDLVALGVLRSFSAAGVRVPDDCAIVGFDDIEVAALLSPPLTSIRLPAYEVGRRAAEILLDEIKRPDNAPPQNVLFQPKLVVRESSGAK